MTTTSVVEVLDSNFETRVVGLFRVGCVKDDLKEEPGLRGGQETWCRGLENPEVVATGAGALRRLRFIYGIDGVENVEVIASVIFRHICARFHPIFVIHDQSIIESDGSDDV